MHYTTHKLVSVSNATLVTPKKGGARDIIIGHTNYQTKIPAYLLNPARPPKFSAIVKNTPLYVSFIFKHVFLLLSQSQYASHHKALVSIARGLSKLCFSAFELKDPKEFLELDSFVLQTAEQDIGVIRDGLSCAFHSVNITRMGLRIMGKLCLNLIAQDALFEKVYSRCPSESFTPNPLLHLPTELIDEIKSNFIPWNTVDKSIMTIQMCVATPLEGHDMFLSPEDCLKLTHFALIMMHTLPDLFKAESRTLSDLFLYLPNDLPHFNVLLRICSLTIFNSQNQAQSRKFDKLKVTIIKGLQEHCLPYMDQVDSKALVCAAMSSKVPMLVPQGQFTSELVGDIVIKCTIRPHAQLLLKQVQSLDPHDFLAFFKKVTFFPAAVFIANHNLTDPIEDLYELLSAMMLKLCLVLEKLDVASHTTEFEPCLSLLSEIIQANPQIMIDALDYLISNKNGLPMDQHRSKFDLLSTLFYSPDTVASLKHLMPPVLFVLATQSCLSAESTGPHLYEILSRLYRGNNFNYCSVLEMYLCERVQRLSGTNPYFAFTVFTNVIHIVRNFHGYRSDVLEGAYHSLQSALGSLPQEMFLITQLSLADTLKFSNLTPEKIAITKQSLKSLLKEQHTPKLIMVYLDLTHPDQLDIYHFLTELLGLPPLPEGCLSPVAHIERVIHDAPVESLNSLDALMQSISPILVPSDVIVRPGLQPVMVSIQDFLTEKISAFYMQHRNLLPGIMHLCHKYHIPLDKFFAQTCRLRENVAAYDIPIPEPLKGFEVSPEGANKFFCEVVQQAMIASESQEVGAHKEEACDLIVLTTHRLIGTHQAYLQTVRDQLFDTNIPIGVTTESLRTNIMLAHSEFRTQYQFLCGSQPTEDAAAPHYSPWQGSQSFLDEWFINTDKAYAAMINLLPDQDVAITPSNAPLYRGGLTTLLSKLKHFMMILGCCQISHVVLNEIGDLTTYNAQDNGVCGNQADIGRSQHLMRRLKEMFLYILSHWNKQISQASLRSIFPTLSSVLSQGTYCNSGLTMALEPVMTSYHRDDPHTTVIPEGDFDSKITLLAACTLRDLTTAALTNSCISTTLFDFISTTLVLIDTTLQRPGQEVMLYTSKTWESKYKGKDNEQAFLDNIGISVDKMEAILKLDKQRRELQKLGSKVRTMLAGKNVHYDTLILTLLSELFQGHGKVDKLVEQDLQAAFTPSELERLKELIQGIFLHTVVSPVHVIKAMFSQISNHLQDPSQHKAPVSYADIRDEMARKHVGDWMTEDFAPRPSLAYFIISIVYQVISDSPEQQDLLFALIAWSLRDKFDIDTTISELRTLVQHLQPTSQLPDRPRKRVVPPNEESDDEEGMPGAAAMAAAAASTLEASRDKRPAPTQAGRVKTKHQRSGEK